MLKNSVIFKTISLIIFLTFILSLFTTYSIAAPEGAVVETTYYSNTFDNGKNSCVDYSDRYGSFTFNKGYIDSSFEGNVGIGAKEGAWGDKSYYVFSEGNEVKTGLVTISFDVSKLARESADKNCGVTFNDKKGNVKYAIDIEKDIIHGPKDYFKDWGDSSVSAEYKINTCYNVKMELDFDNYKIYTYIDNVLLTERALKTDFVLYDIDFSFSMLAAYVDNIYISHKYYYPFEVYIGSEKSGNIFYNNEEINLNIDVVNRFKMSAETKLNLVVTDSESEETVYIYETETISLSARGKKRILVNIPVKDFGVYKVTATDKYNNSFSAEFSKSLKSFGNNESVGVCAHFDDTMHQSGDVETLMEIADNAGFGYIRSDWPRVLDDDGNLTDHFETNEKFSTYIKESFSKDIGMYALVIKLNGSYTDADGGFATTQEALLEFESYCEQLAKKFKDKVTYFEIGNEVDQKRNNDETIAPPGDYVEFLKAGYNGIKKGNINAKVVAFASTVITPEVNTYIRDALDIMKNEGKYYFDAISVHPYHGVYAPEIKNWWDATDWIMQSERLNKIIEDYELYETEKIASELGGVTSGASNEEYNLSYHKQAVFYARKIFLNYAMDMYKIMMFYNLQDNNYKGYLEGDQRGLINNWNYNNWKYQNAYGAKSAYVAISFINSLLIDTKCKSYTENDDVYRCTFEGENKKFEVVWDVYDTQTEITLDKKAQLYDIYGNLKEVGATKIIATSVPVIAVYEDFILNFEAKSKRQNALLNVLEDDLIKMSVMTAHPLKTAVLAQYQGGNLKNIYVSKNDKNGYAFFDTSHLDNATYKLILLDDISNIIPLTDSIKLQ